MVVRTRQKRLNAHPVQIVRVGEDVILKRGCTETRLAGKGVSEAIRLLLVTTSKSPHTRKQLENLFSSSARPHVNRLIDLLVERGFLVSGNRTKELSNGHESTLDVFYWNFGESAKTVERQLKAAHITVLGVNLISCRLLEMLSTTGFGPCMVVDHPHLRNRRQYSKIRIAINEHGHTLKAWKQGDWGRNVTGDSDCLVATSDFDSQEILREINVFCMQEKKMFFPVLLKNFVGNVGPMIIPGETACFECLRCRQHSHCDNLDALQEMAAVAHQSHSIIGFHPSMASVLGDIAAFELTKFYSEVLPKQRIGTLIEVNLLTCHMEPRVILKLPRCSVCSPLKITPSIAITKASIDRNDLANDSRR